MGCNICRCVEGSSSHAITSFGCRTVFGGFIEKRCLQVQQTMKTASSDEELAFKQKAAGPMAAPREFKKRSVFF